MLFFVYNPMIMHVLLLTFIQQCCILYMHIADAHILSYLLKWSFLLSSSGQKQLWDTCGKTFWVYCQ